MLLCYYTDDSVLVPVAVVIVAGPCRLYFELFKSLYPCSQYWPDLNILVSTDYMARYPLKILDLLIKPVHVDIVQVGVVGLLFLGGRLAAEVVTTQPLTPVMQLWNLSDVSGTCHILQQVCC